MNNRPLTFTVDEYVPDAQGRGSRENMKKITYFLSVEASDAMKLGLRESVSRKTITEAQIRKVIREELIKFLEEAKLTEPVEIGAITVNELIKAEKIGKEGKQDADPTTGIRRPAELSFPVLLRSIKNKDEKMPIYKNNFGIVYVKVPYTDEGGQMDLTLDGDVKPIVKQMRLIKEE
jgi:hypothetical protein